MAINSLSASSYGLSGLVSGMDTQSIVEKLLTGTQSKIDQASQKKTTLQYKQQMYRDVANQLKKLQSSFLSYTSGTNLLSSSFYNTMSATVKPPSGVSAAFSVSASSSASVGNVTMNWIQQLATARTSKTQVDASADVSSVFDKGAAHQLANQYGGADADMTIQVGDKTITIVDAVGQFAGKAPSEVVRILNEAFAAEGGVATASYVNNKLQIKAANDEDFISIKGNTDANANNPALAVLMFGNQSSYGNKGTFSAEINTDKYQPSFEVNLDGRTQTIYLDVQALRAYASNISPHPDDPDQRSAAKRLTDSINTQLTRAFGSSIQLSEVKNGADEVVGFSLDTASKTQKFTITGNSQVTGLLGIKSGISNKLNTALSLRDLNFANELQGSVQKFSINGVEFSYTADTQLSKVISDINNSKAGVKISYVESEDRFVIQSAETGAGTPAFELKQTEGNLLTSLFGVAGGNTVTGHGVNQPMLSSVMNDDILNHIGDGGVFTFNVNGQDYRFSVSRDAKDTPFDPTSLAEELNKQFKNTFGTLPDGTQAITFEYTDDRRFAITTNDKNLELTATKPNSLTNTNMLGFTTGQSTRVKDGDTALADAGIVFGDGDSITINVQGVGPITIGADDLKALNGDADNDVDPKSFNDLAALINSKIAAGMPSGSKLPTVEFDEKSAAFKVVGVDIPMEITIAAGSGKNLDNIFGQMNVKVSEAAKQYNTGTDDAPVWADVLKSTDDGQNAKFRLNGIDMERASNSFTIDGLTYTLNGTTHKDQNNPDYNSTTPSDYEQATTINVTRDTEKIVEGLQEFLKMYNETVDMITNLFRADTTYKDYPPLTAAQKAEMSESEIKNWEEKSKEGLLRGDQYLENILAGLRGALNARPDGSTLALYDLGITTSFYSNDGNFTEQGEGLLKKAVESDPEAVYRLFAGDGGLMEVLNDAINGATRSSYANPGSLVTVAGSNALDTGSTIYKQIKEIDTQLETLETRYWNEYNRYWKQFNSMEQLISQMNSQSGWLSQMTGG